MSSLAVLAWVALLWAARAAPAGQYYFDVFGPEAGLPQTNVVTALQTRDGYLWVGTEGGLGRFDGVRFVTWRRTNTPALANHSIRALFEDREGVLWIGTERGVVRYRDGRFEPAGLESAIVTAMAQDRAGQVWLGTGGAGLHVWRGSRIEPVESPVVGRTASILCVQVDSRDRLWVGLKGEAGVAIGEQGQWRRFSGGNRMTGETNAVCELPAGTIWIGNAHGLYRVRGETVNYYAKGHGLVSMQVRDVRPARDGGLWVAAGLLHHVANPEEVVCTPIPSPAVRSIQQVWEDVEGNVWVCAMAEALVRVRRAPFRTLAEELPSPVVKAVGEDPQGNLWLALQRDGVMRLDRQGRLQRILASGLPTSNPLAVLAARDGTVWMGFSTGLGVWRNDAMEVDRTLDGVHTIFEARDGRIWLGRPEGTIVHEPGRGFAELKADAGPPVDVHAFAEDASGAIYFGHGSGVRKVRAGVAENIGAAPELPTGPVRALHVDREGRLWVGMKGRGLGVYAEGKWLNPDTLADAVSDHVSAIAEDTDGRLWLGTPGGVMWGDKNDLLALARGDRRAPRLRVAGQGDGSRVMPVSSGSQPAAWAGREGELFFATRRGLLRIDPRDVPTNGVAPQVHIEQVTVDGRPVPRGRRVEIPAGAQAVAIDYTAPSFVDPARVRFQYQLSGYERDWVQAGPRRTAFYTNLAPGAYVFRVKASNSDGVWNERGAELEIVQRPYFYQTWWFYGLAALGLAGAGIGANRWSHRRLALRLALLEEKQAAERDRRRIAKDLHDDIGASLTEIGLFAEKMKRQAPEPEVATLMTFFAGRVRRIAASLDAVVWAVNPANDSLDRLASFIVEMFQDFLRVTPIRCRLDVAPAFPAQPLTPEQRSHLFLTAKEAINNLVRHSGATEAWLRMEVADGVFRLTIEDNGRGFDPATARPGGNGLANMRSRIAELGGELHFETAPGHGTRVRVALPLPAPLAAEPALSP